MSDLPSLETFGPMHASQELKVGGMPESRTTAIAIRADQPRTAVAWQATTTLIVRAAIWAGDTAQEFGAVLSALLAPIVFCAYVFAFWSLAASLGWTDTFIFSTGPLSNWLVWTGMAVLVTLAAGILQRRTRPEN